jgi:Na+(H+)/acetate symporter ActP
VSQCTNAYAASVPDPGNLCTCLATQFSKAVSFDDYDRIMRKAMEMNSNVTDARMVAAMTACVPGR